MSFPTLLLSIVLLTATTAFAQTTQTTQPASDFSRLDEKLQKATASGKWSETSLLETTSYYGKYKAAHAAGTWGVLRRDNGERWIPVAKSPEEYVGTFGMPTNEGGKARPFVTITREADGRMFAMIEKRRIPAAPLDGAIVFTTGDIVYATKAPLAGKPDAKLETFTIAKTNDGWALVDPSGKPNRTLVKIETGAAE